MIHIEKSINKVHWKYAISKALAIKDILKRHTGDNAPIVQLQIPLEVGQPPFTFSLSQPTLALNDVNELLGEIFTVSCGGGGFNAHGDWEQETLVDINCEKMDYSIKEDFIVDKKKFPMLQITNGWGRTYFLNPFVNSDNFMHGVGDVSTGLYYSEIVKTPLLKENYLLDIVAHCGSDVIEKLIILTLKRNAEMVGDPLFNEDMMFRLHEHYNRYFIGMNYPIPISKEVYTRVREAAAEFHTQYNATLDQQLAAAEKELKEFQERHRQKCAKIEAKKISQPEVVSIKAEFDPPLANRIDGTETSHDSQVNKK
jgi:hypothetical protein